MKPISLFYVILFTALVAFSPVQAQQTLSLNEAVQIALEHNQAIRISQEDYRKAEAQITESRAGTFPFLTMNGTFSYDIKQPLNGFPVGDSVFAFGSGEKDNYVLNATLVQKLFDPSVFIAPQAAKIFAKLSGENVNVVRQQTIWQTKTAYFGVLLAEAFAEVKQQELEQIQATLERIKMYRETGRAADFDVLRAQVEVANVRPQLIQAQNGVELAKAQLRNVLNLPPDRDISLSDTLAFIEMNLTFDAALAMAKAHRPDLKALQYQIEGYHKYLRSQQYDRIPTLTGMLQYQAVYDHYQLDGDDWNPTLQGIISVDFPYVPFLDGGLSRGRINQAKANYRKAQLQYEQALNGVILEVKQAVLNLNEAAQRVEASQLNIERAQEALKISELRYANGLVTQLEVRDARLALTAARTNYIQALHDHNVARVTLEKVIGMID